MGMMTDYIPTQLATPSTLFRVGMLMAPFAEWFSEEQGRPSHESAGDLGIRLNAGYRPHGVNAELSAWEAGSRRITPETTVPLTEEGLAALIPDEAHSVTLTFRPAGAVPYGSPSIRIQSREGQAFVVVEVADALKATEVLDAVGNILREFPPVPVEEPSVARGPITVFIGHGGSDAWEVVRDYLGAEGFNVIHFDSDERVGENTLYAIDGMLRESDVAVVVMTGNDEMVDGTKRARENVVHEIGLSQGRLGIPNTFILLENGCSEFTNIAGITQIRFNVNGIHRTKDRVLAGIARRVETPHLSSL
jgi:hypothetical protein